MPIERSRYPEDWPTLSHRVKEAAGWKCEECHRPCRMPGESLPSSISRIQGKHHPDLDWVNQTAIAYGRPEVIVTITDFPQRFTLTTAHLDQNPGNNQRTNLKALCSVCHLNHDRPHRIANSYGKRERRGQLKLPLELEQ